MYPTDRENERLCYPIQLAKCFGVYLNWCVIWYQNASGSLLVCVPNMSLVEHTRNNTMSIVMPVLSLLLNTYFAIFHSVTCMRLRKRTNWNDYALNIYIYWRYRDAYIRACVHMKKEKNRVLFVYLYTQRDPCDRLFMYATICEERWKSQQESRQIMCRASIEIPVNQSIKKETNKERNNKRNWRVEREEMALLIF